MRAHWRFPAAPASVAEARRALREAARARGADARLVEAMTLCVSEAVTNAVLHAYRGGSSGDVELEIEQNDGALVVHVKDSGVGMLPRLDSPGIGFGLPLIGRLASELSVHARKGDSGTELIMRFDLAGDHVASARFAHGSAP